MKENGFVAAVMEAEQIDSGGPFCGFQYFKGTTAKDFHKGRSRVYMFSAKAVLEPEFSEFYRCEMLMRGCLPGAHYAD